MKLATIELDGVPRVAVVADEDLVDLTVQLGVGLSDLWRFLAMGEEGYALARRSLQSATSRLSLGSVRLRSPVPYVDKVLGIAMNYHSFVAASRRLGIVIPEERFWFYRPRSCITGPYDDVWLPRNASDFDYEAELAIVVGRRCRHITPGDAPAVLAGFAVANDLTLRERVRKSPVLGKSFDTHTPLGPWMVTPDEIGDPHNLAMRTWVNGELRQQSSTADMIADCYELIAEISSACTLNPGDIILTGTPAGCGMFRRPPAGLVTGDIVKVEIEGIGVIENRVVDEPPVDGDGRAGMQLPVYVPACVNFSAE